MPGEYQLDPVYSQLSATRDDLLQGYSYPMMGQPGTGALPSYDMTTLIMNPTPPPPPFVPMNGYEASIYPGRIAGMQSMGDAYAQAMSEVSKRRTTFDLGFGVAEGLAFAIPSLMGHPWLGMGLQMGMGFLREPIADLFNINDIEPVITSEEYTRGMISQQMSQMAYASNNAFLEDGRGISRNEANRLGSQVYGMMRSQGLQGMEIGRIAPYIMQSGALGEVNNLEELTDTVAKQVETIANFVKRAGSSIEQAAQLTSGLYQAGVPLDSLNQVANTIIAGAGAANVDATYFAQAAVSFAQPYRAFGDPSQSIGMFSEEATLQGNLYRSGEIPTNLYMAGGGALGIGSAIAKTSMDYWLSPQNFRILAAMQATGGYNANAMAGMLSGEAFPEGLMNQYSNMTTDQRLAARWSAGEILMDNPQNFTDAMLVRMFDKMEENDITSPLAQRQYLVEHYGIPRELAQGFERREEFMWDPRERIGALAGAHIESAQATRTAATTRYSEIITRTMNLGRAFRNPGLLERAGDEAEAYAALAGGADYMSWMNDQITENRFVTILGRDEPTARATQEDISILGMTSQLAGMTTAERSVYGPLFARAATAAARSTDIDYRVLAGREAGVNYYSSGEFEASPTFRYDQATNQMFMDIANPATGETMFSRAIDENMMLRSGQVISQVDSNGRVEVGRGALMLDPTRWLNTMDAALNNVLDVQSPESALIGAMNSVGSSVYTTPYATEYASFMRQMYGSRYEQSLTATAKPYQRFAAGYSDLEFALAMPTSADINTANAGYAMATDPDFNRWFQEASRTLGSTASADFGSMDATNIDDVSGFVNGISKTLFGMGHDDPRMSQRDRDYLSRLVAISYPTIATNSDQIITSAQANLAEAYTDLRTAASDASVITPSEMRRRSSVMSEFGLGEEMMPQVAGILMRATTEGGGVADAARALGITDENIINAATRFTAFGGVAYGATVAMGDQYTSQLNTARQVLNQYSTSLVARDAEGNLMNTREAIEAYFGGADINFSVAPQAANTDAGRVLSGFTATDKITSDVMSQLSEFYQRQQQQASQGTGSGAGNGSDNETPSPAGFSIETANVTMTGATTISATAGVYINGATVGGGGGGSSPGNGLSTGTPGDSGINTGGAPGSTSGMGGSGGPTRSP